MDRGLHGLTVESIETALILMLETKTLDEINVRELCKKAGVSHNSYYRNFRSKEEVLQSYLVRTLVRIDTMAWRRVAEEGSFYGYWLCMFTEWRKLRKFFLILDNAGRSGDLFKQINLASTQILEKKDLWQRYRENLLYGAMANVTQEWLRNGAKESPEEMAQFCMVTLGSLSGINRREEALQGKLGKTYRHYYESMNEEKPRRPRGGQDKEK